MTPTASALKIADSEALPDLPFGDFAPLTRHVRGADHMGETVYVNRRNVSYVAPRGSGCSVFLTGGGSLELVESARETVAMLS